MGFLDSSLPGSAAGPGVGSVAIKFEHSCGPSEVSEILRFLANGIFSDSSTVERLQLADVQFKRATEAVRLLGVSAAEVRIDEVTK